MLKDIFYLKEKLNPYKDETYPVYWVSKYIYRNISFIITFIINKTKINANQVSAFMMLIGFISAILFMLNKFIIGIIFLHLWYLFDIIDGEVARIKNQSSQTGAYFDHLIHFLNHPFILIGFSYGIVIATNNLNFLLFGILSGVFNLIYRARLDCYQMFKYKNQKSEVEYKEKSLLTFIGRLKVYIIKSIHFPHIINIMTLTIVCDFVFDFNLLLSKMYIIYLGILIPIFVFSVILRDIKNKVLD